MSKRYAYIVWYYNFTNIQAVERKTLVACDINRATEWNVPVKCPQKKEFQLQDSPLILASNLINEENADFTISFSD